MYKKIKDNKFILIIISIAILISAIFLTFEKIIAGKLGVPLDDVFIHIQFSKNLSLGKGFSYNCGVQTPGSTSPLWTILITIPYLFFKNHLLVTKILSFIFYLTSGVLTFKLGSRILESKRMGVIVTVFTLMTGRFAWSALSGMEVTLFTSALLLIVLSIKNDKSSYLISALLGISSAIRPEGYVIFIFYLLHIFSNTKNKISKVAIKKYFTIGIIYAIFVIPYFCFSYITTGNFLPNTFNAQNTSGLIFQEKIRLVFLYLARYLYITITDNPLATLGLVFSIYFFFKLKKKKLIFLYSVTFGYPLCASILAPNLRHHARYTMPLIPFYIIVGFQGLKYFADKVYKINQRIRILTITLGFIYSLISLYIWASTYGWNVKNINKMQVHLGRWIEKNIDKDKTLAINDIGAIKYYSQNEIIDLVGLVSPEIIEITKDKNGYQQEQVLWEYITEQKADYLIIFPAWYPHLSQKKALNEVYRVSLDRYTIIDGEMVVYEIDY